MEWLIKLWYKTPRITFKFRNPFIIEERDYRSLQWYKQRKKYGFDERAMWNLGYDLHAKISAYLETNDELTFEEFDKWFKNNLKDLTWLYARLKFYIEYNCPTFFHIIDDGEYKSLSTEEQAEMLLKLKSIIEQAFRNNYNDEDTKILKDNIFTLGW